MKFALYGGKKVEAEATLKGALCPVCDAEVIAKCGDKNIHHWAHKSNKECPHWWENETKWHRDWKNQFPEDWQEVVLYNSETGEKHIADVKKPNDLVVEFQHSSIKKKEVSTRNNFYKNIIWIVDGKRRPTDEKKFEEALEWRGWDSSRLLKDWTIFPKPVFFDFGKPLLWGVSDGFIIKFEKKDFIISVKNGSIKRKIDNKINTEMRRRMRGRMRGRMVWGSKMKRGY
jgi:competence protein CoiA